MLLMLMPPPSPPRHRHHHHHHHHHLTTSLSPPPLQDLSRHSITSRHYPRSRAWSARGHSYGYQEQLWDTSSQEEGSDGDDGGCSEAMATQLRISELEASMWRERGQREKQLAQQARGNTARLAKVVRGSCMHACSACSTCRHACVHMLLVVMWL
jgi:hypothetical protein